MIITDDNDKASNLCINMNDKLEFNFQQIADKIKKEPELFFEEAVANTIKKKYRE